MLKVKQAIIVEGKYDKIKLGGIIDGTIIETGGFRIFKDKAMAELIKKLAATCGIIVITDSDVAGFKIRNYIKSITKNDNVINIYIPDILGKEKRKATPSKEGKLGVEGIENQIILDAFEKAGIVYDENVKSKMITKSDFFEDQLSGRDNSSALRRAFLKHLDLPEHLTTNSLVDVINSIITYDQYKKIINEIKKKLDF